MKIVWTYEYVVPGNESALNLSFNMSECEIDTELEMISTRALVHAKRSHAADE